MSESNFGLLPSVGMLVLWSEKLTRERREKIRVETPRKNATKRENGKYRLKVDTVNFSLQFLTRPFAERNVL